MEGIIAIIVIATSIWVLIDAKRIGVKKGQVQGLGNLGPWGWFFACLLLWIIGFPFYLAKRPEFKRINATPSTQVAVEPKSTSSQTFHVVLEGRTLADQEVGQVAANLGKLFKRPAEQLVPLLQGKPLVVKRSLDEATALRYQAAIQQAGAACRVEPEQLDVDLPLPAATDEIKSRDFSPDAGVANPSIKVGESSKEKRSHFRDRAVLWVIGFAVLIAGYVWTNGFHSKPWEGASNQSQVAASKTGPAPHDSITSPAKQSGTDEYVQIISRAKQFISEWNREDPLCDEITSPGLANIQRGKVSFITVGGGKVEPPIPAIVAKVTGTCVISAQRVRAPLTKWWLMMAYDESFNQYSCINMGGANLLRAFVKEGCVFTPNPGESGLIATANAPGISVVEDDPCARSAPECTERVRFENLKLMGLNNKQIDEFNRRIEKMVR